MTHDEAVVALQTERGALAALRDLLPSLTQARRRVAEVVLADPWAAGDATITALATSAGTDAATVTRLAVSMGYPGFPALRAAVARDAGRGEQAAWSDDIGSEIGEDDPPARVLEVLARDRYQALRNTRALLDVDAVQRLATAVVDATHVRIYGEWGDGVVARELHQRLIRSGVSSWHLEGAKSAEAAVLATGAGDVALVVSRTGDDPAAVHFLAASGTRGAVTACLTGAPASELARAADIGVFTGTEAGPYWTDYAGGRESDSLTASLLWVLVMQHRTFPGTG
ncbi:MurR/RpiR family transcriptional regulator [Agromyces sp. SYSU T00194]|uniref:MurR/RpiR family transcriptional regulator n=1 Tax=Agromyces chitinivorans TaxID=3158560 RepID=UPI003397F4C1